VIPTTRGGKTGDHPRRDHHQQGAQSLAVAARYPRHAGEQHVGEPGGIFFLGNDAASFDAADGKRTGKFVQLARGQPGNVPKSAEFATNVAAVWHRAIARA
jgi:hypothetical protein